MGRHRQSRITPRRCRVNFCDNAPGRIRAREDPVTGRISFLGISPGSSHPRVEQIFPRSGKFASFSVENSQNCSGKENALNGKGIVHVRAFRWGYHFRYEQKMSVWHRIT
jgi:hypothetical protein